MGNSFTANLSVLEGRLTAARAGYLDNLSVGAVALDSKMDIVDTNVDTLLTRLSAARAGYLDNLDAPIANVYVGEINIPNSVAGGTATITSVNQTKTMLFWQGQRSTDSGAMAADDNLGNLYFNSNTELASVRVASPATQLLVRFRVMEMA